MDADFEAEIGFFEPQPPLKANTAEIGESCSEKKVRNFQNNPCIARTMLVQLLMYLYVLFFYLILVCEIAIRS